MYIGIDLGGTNIAIGIVSEDGKILLKDSTPTLLPRDYTEIVFDMQKLIKRLLEKSGYDISEIKGIGIGCPGSVDAKNGVVSYSNNLKMHHTPLVSEIKKYFDLPVSILNDADAAAFGEYMINGNGVDSYYLPNRTTKNKLTTDLKGV